METWEQYRARGVETMLSLLDAGKGWKPSYAQTDWLRKYATAEEAVKLRERGIELFRDEAGRWVA